MLPSLGLVADIANVGPLELSMISNDGELINKINYIILDLKKNGSIDKVAKLWLTP